MEDRDTGAGAPEVGASSASRRASRLDGGSSRPTESPLRRSGQAGDARNTRRASAKKRRKRRRGRKVFARDEAHATGNRRRRRQRSSPRRSGNQPPKVGGALPAGRAGTARSRAPHRPPLQELCRSLRRSTSAPTIAGCWSPCRRGMASSASSTPSRASSGWARGSSANGRLGQPAMDRAVEALKICGDKLRNRKIRKARLIATEACRSAENGVEFLDRVEARGRAELEIIDRQTEARLAVSGCGSLVERDTQGVVLFDIGGGSSEIALIDVTGQRSPRLANHIVVVDVAAGRRRVAGRAFWRPHGHARDLRRHGRRRRRHAAQLRRPRPARPSHGQPEFPSARHVGHGDDAGRRPP